MPQSSFYFQDTGSTISSGIIDLHHNLLTLLLFIFFFVLFCLVRILINNKNKWNIYNKYNTKNQNSEIIYERIIHGNKLEIIWTILPSLILFLIAVPSFSLLYSMEEIKSSELIVKAIGSQWYWGYEYGLLDLNWDSYLLTANDLKTGMLRLLTVDHPLILPAEVNTKIIVTSTDVIHAFGVPSLGIKTDAVPGRLNQLSFLIKRTGIFYGSCYELCGAGHGYMPIQIVAI
jgi:cytochrome c oxidase subunit 2